MSSEVAKAKLQIAEILKDLEIATGQSVAEVSISHLEMTTMHSTCREWRRSVSIHLNPKPGGNWKI